jgi:transcriptional regulator with XRE-family HTH domain
MSPETLRKIETGRIATPSFMMLAALAEELGLSLDVIQGTLRKLSNEKLDVAS